MSDELHRISTKALLKALGGPTRPVHITHPSVMKMVLALLRLRCPVPTPRAMLEEYVYGWDENGGAHSNSIGAGISQYNITHRREPILSVYGAGYFLSGSALNAMASRAHTRNARRLALQEAAQ